MKLESLCALIVAALVTPAMAMAEDGKAPEHDKTLSTNVVLAGLGLVNAEVEWSSGTHYASEVSVAYGNPVLSDDDLMISALMAGGKWYLNDRKTGLLAGWRVARVHASNGTDILGPGGYVGYRLGGENGGWTAAANLGGIYNLLGESRDSTPGLPFAEILVGYRF